MRTWQEKYVQQDFFRFRGAAKGQSILLTHTILVSFGVVLVLLVVTTFVTLRDEFQNFTAENEINHICFIVKSAAEMAYYEPDYFSPSGTGTRLVVRLPDRLADIPYSVRFSEKRVIVETEGLMFRASCNVGFEATYSGSSSGGLTEVTFNITPGLRAFGMRNI